MPLSYERKLSASERQQRYHSDCKHIQWGNKLHICRAIGLLVCHECYEHFTMDHIRHECTKRA